MSLRALQSAFRDEIVADDEGLAPSSPGMAIYRDAYRGRLLAALETSFERTRQWTGEEAFATAACHYILTRPPKGWTLDEYGADFPELLASLFAEDPEVAELAWLEWQLSVAFAAPDQPVFDAAAFAENCQSDTAWDHVSFKMAAGFAMRPVRTNCAALWDALAERQESVLSAERVAPAWLLVWRCGLTPSYRMITPSEAEALRILSRGGMLGELATVNHAGMLGNWLVNWFSEGIFATADPMISAELPEGAP